MAANTKDLKDKLGAGKAPAPAQGANSQGNTVEAYIKKMGPKIAEALPRHMNMERFSRMAITVIRQTPQLLNCDMVSLLGAVMKAAQLGLEPGLLGHCYIIPYGKEATFILGYKGMIDLARRSGNIQSIAAHEVYENDFIKVEYGINETLQHIPWHLREDKQFSEPGKLRGAYMVAKFRDGGHYIHYMPVHEIEQHRRRSKAASNGPWVTDYIEMCKKTVVRSGWKWLPISVEIMKAGMQDETVANDITPLDVDDGVVIDMTAEYGERVDGHSEQEHDLPQGPAIPEGEPVQDSLV
jgi:recombination protein RecT